MKLRAVLSLLAGAVALCAISQNANATTITLGSQNTTDLGALPSPTLTPGTQSGSFLASITGSVPNEWRSPFGDNTTPYSVLSPGPGNGSGNAGQATFTTPTNTTAVSLLWGSPDSFNFIEFFDGATPVAVTGFANKFSGSNLVGPATAGAGFDYVTFNVSGPITSFVLSDNGQPAFEYADVLVKGSVGTPIPAALPLFAGGLGVLGLFARRKRKSAVAA